MILNYKLVDLNRNLPILSIKMYIYICMHMYMLQLGTCAGRCACLAACMYICMCRSPTFNIKYNATAPIATF